MPPANPAQKRIRALEAQVAQLQASLDAANQAVAQAQAGYTAVAQERDRIAAALSQSQSHLADVVARLSEAQAKLDSMPDPDKLSEEIRAEWVEWSNREAMSLISCQAELKRAERSANAARGGIYLLLSEKSGVPVEKIPESDVDAVCDRWEARFS